ncbi:MAG TPA: GAF and ANTAR domain-containing protein [Iamia sp.]
MERDIRRLNELFRSQRTLSTKLEAVAELVQRAVPRCDSASFSLIVEEAMVTGASTSQLAIEADLVQYRVDEGPCVSSAREQSSIRIDALQHDERFEHFAPGAVEMGIESVLSIPLGSDEHAVGSLNLYSRERDAFTDDDPDRVSELVAYAVHLIVASLLYEASVDTMARLVEVVHQAEQVEIAVGVLMFSEGLTPAEAWDVLRVRAAEHGESIVECALRLIDEHERSIDHPEEPS